MPRKSTASAAPTGTNGDGDGDIPMASEAPAPPVSSATQTQSKGQPSSEKQGQGKRKSEGDVVALDDLLLPRSIVQRISKGVLPANTSIAKDAILALTKSATVFISHLASEANDMTERKTIQSQDVVKALREIEMDGVMGLGQLQKDGRRGGRIEREVEKWEGDVRGKRRGYREKVRARESGVGAGDTTVGDTTVATVDVEGADQDREHENKRVRMDEQDARDSSAGPITTGTQGLKLNVGRRKSDEIEHGRSDDAADDDVEDDEDEQEDEAEDEEEQEHDETQDADDSMDVEDADSRPKNGALAPDGRAEVEDSDEESD